MSKCNPKNNELIKRISSRFDVPRESWLMNNYNRLNKCYYDAGPLSKNDYVLSLTLHQDGGPYREQVNNIIKILKKDFGCCNFHRGVHKAISRVYCEICFDEKITSTV